MFSAGLDAGCIADFLALSDRPSFEGISTGTCKAAETPALVLHAPLRNTIEALDTLTPIEVLAEELAPHRPDNNNVIALRRLQGA